MSEGPVMVGLEAVGGYLHRFDRLNVPCRIREWKHGNLGGLAQKLQSCKRESGFFDSFFFSANRSRSVELSPSRRIDVLVYLADRRGVAPATGSATPQQG